MDGPNGTKSTNRNSRTPGDSQSKSRASTIRDPKVLYQKGFISEAQMNAAIARSEKACKEAFDDVCVALNFEGLVGSPTQQPSNSPDDKENLLRKTQAKKYDFLDCKDGSDSHSKADNSLIAALLKGYLKNLNTPKDGAFFTTKITQYRNNIAQLLQAHKEKQEAETDKHAKEKTLVLGKDDSIDLEHLPFLLKAMKDDKALKNNDLKIELWLASITGEPVKCSIGDGTNTVILFKSKNGFMVVTPKENNSANDGPLVEEVSDDDDNKV